MPRRDGTGPIGMGMMTGFGGYGSQRGCRRRFALTGIPGYLSDDYAQTIQKSEDKTYLEMLKSRLEMQLNAVQERLSNLNNTDE